MGVSLAVGFYLTLKHPHQDVSQILSPSIHSPIKIHHVPTPASTQLTQEISSIFPILGTYPFLQSLLPCLSGAIDCCMVILYFTDNIHL